MAFKVTTDGKTDAEIGREIDEHLADDFAHAYQQVVMAFTLGATQVAEGYKERLEKKDPGAKSFFMAGIMQLEVQRSQALQDTSVWIANHALEIIDGDEEDLDRYREALQFEDEVSASLDELPLTSDFSTEGPLH